ncbi:MAG: hypothetical protein ACLTK0_08480 [Anaerovoracaceae bacterium]
MRSVETSVTGEVAGDKGSIESMEKETAVVTGPESLVKKWKSWRPI